MKLNSSNPLPGGPPQGSAGGTYAKVGLKIPQIARWRVAGITDQTIAKMLGMSTSGLARILATPEYLEYESCILQGHLTAMDRALSGKVEAIRQELRQAVPGALRTVVEVAMQRRDMKAAFAAAKEILDRDPDRILPNNGEELAAPGVPAEVLQEAAKQGNEIAENYDKSKVM